MKTMAPTQLFLYINLTTKFQSYPRMKTLYFLGLKPKLFMCKHACRYLFICVKYNKVLHDKFVCQIGVTNSIQDQLSCLCTYSGDSRLRM